MTRVWVAYDPQVFREALIHSLAKLEGVEVVEDAGEGIDIGIFRLAATGQLQNYFLYNSLPTAKLIVFSPHGDKAYIRLPGTTHWDEVSPFGLNQLAAEIQAGRDARVTIKE